MVALSFFVDNDDHGNDDDVDDHVDDDLEKGELGGFVGICMAALC